MNLNMQPNVSDLYKYAAKLGPKDLLLLLKKLTILQFKRRGVNVLEDKEAVLLQELNEGFPSENWNRLKELDRKMEKESLNEKEKLELLQLSEDYENISVRRLKILVQLAEIRSVTVETLTSQLGIQPTFHA